MRGITFSALAVLIILCAETFGEDPPSPFGSVVRHGDHIDATIARTRWLAIGDSPAGRIVGPGDSFTLPAGASFRLAEHHSSYQVRCRLSPPPAGLEVIYSFDARPFGGAQTTRTFFIAAQ